MECESVRTTKARLTRHGSVLIAGSLLAVGAFMPSAFAAGALTLSGVATCQNDGTYSVVWSGAADRADAPSAAQLTVTSVSPASAAATPTDQTVQGNSPFTVTETGIDGSAATATISVSAAWDDETTASATGSVELSGDCVRQADPAGGFTPPEPTFTSVVCDAANAIEPSYTIPSVDGVEYDVNGVPTAAGTYPVWTGKVTVTAVSTDGRALSGTTSWSFTFPGEDCAIVDLGTPPLPPAPHPSSGREATRNLVDATPVEPSVRHVTNPPVAVADAELAATGRLDRALLALGLLSVASGAVMIAVARRRAVAPSGRVSA